MVNESPMRLASIDIGSNAIRLFIGQKSRSGKVTVLEDARASVRLGKDAFSVGYIRPHTIGQLEDVFLQFRDICDEFNVHRIRAVGTSALRDSSNSRKVIEKLKNKTGIAVNLIDGH